MANEILVYGGIVDLRTNEEVEFDGDALEVAVAKLKNLAGTVYGTDWEYAGDLTAEDSDANIYVSGVEVAYDGSSAIADFLAKYDF